jgi:hypothetical protein
VRVRVRVRVRGVGILGVSFLAGSSWIFPRRFAILKPFGQTPPDSQMLIHPRPYRFLLSYLLHLYILFVLELSYAAVIVSRCLFNGKKYRRTRIPI